MNNISQMMQNLGNISLLVIRESFLRRCLKLSFIFVNVDVMLYLSIIWIIYLHGANQIYES